jgi:hypothetical protein
VIGAQGQPGGDQAAEGLAAVISRRRGQGERAKRRQLIDVQQGEQALELLVVADREQLAQDRPGIGVRDQVVVGEPVEKRPFVGLAISRSEPAGRGVLEERLMEEPDSLPRRAAEHALAQEVGECSGAGRRGGEMQSLENMLSRKSFSVPRARSRARRWQISCFAKASGASRP